jgi:hypothetical protein
MFKRVGRVLASAWQSAESATETLWTLVRKHPVPALTLAGVGLFCIRWGSYELFYSRLGTSSPEVGLGFNEALVQAITAATGWALMAVVVTSLLLFVAVLALLAIGIITTILTAGFAAFYLAVLMMNPVFAIIFGPKLLGSKTRREESSQPGDPRLSDQVNPQPRGSVAKTAASEESSRPGDPPSSDQPNSEDPGLLVEAFAATGLVVNGMWGALKRTAAFRSRLLRALPTIGVIGLVLVQFAVLIVAGIESGRAKEGHGVDSPGLLGIPLTELQALPSRVDWLSDATAPGPIATKDCLLYLGQADGTAVLYEPGRDSTLRVPTGAVAVTARTSCVSDD